MSMGAKMRAAALALKAAGVPTGIPTGELGRCIADKLTEFGYRSGELPNPRTFLRHLDELRALMQPADLGTLCHFQHDDPGGISDATEPPTTEDQQGMQAEPRSLIDRTMLRRESILSVPFGHGIDHELAPTYLRACVVKNGLAPRDVIELRAHDFSWIAKLLIVSVNKAAWSATTRLLMAPTFLLGSADHSPLFIVDQLNVVEQDYRQRQNERGRVRGPKPLADVPARSAALSLPMVCRPAGRAGSRT
jgi:hypothetical protein